MIMQSKLYAFFKTCNLPAHKYNEWKIWPDYFMFLRILQYLVLPLINQSTRDKIDFQSKSFNLFVNNNSFSLIEKYSIVFILNKLL